MTQKLVDTMQQLTNENQEAMNLYGYMACLANLHGMAKAAEFQKINAIPMEVIIDMMNRMFKELMHRGNEEFAVKIVNELESMWTTHEDTSNPDGVPEEPFIINDSDWHDLMDSMKGEK